MRAGQVAGKGRIAQALALLGASLAAPGGRAGRERERRTGPVRVTTGGVAHVTGTTGQLQGTLIADNIAVSVYFEYGPNGPPFAYASKTKPLVVPPPVPVPPTPKSVKVGQAVTGLLAGYHYRICASFTPSGGTLQTVCGKDKSFTGGKASKLRFRLGKGKEDRLGVVYGGTLELTGAPDRQKQRQPRPEPAGDPLPLHRALRHDRRHGPLEPHRELPVQGRAHHPEHRSCASSPSTRGRSTARS